MNFNELAELLKLGASPNVGHATRKDIATIVTRELSVYTGKRNYVNVAPELVPACDKMYEWLDENKDKGLPEFVRGNNKIYLVKRIRAISQDLGRDMGLLNAKNLTESEFAGYL